MDLPIHPSKGLRGQFSVPGDKSISHRAVLFGALAEGETTIEGLSNAADVRSTISCIEALGVETESGGARFIIHGKGPRGFRKSQSSLNAGNSGTTMRLLSGILSGQRFDSVIVGDSSLSRRPMKRIIEPLKRMGANIAATPEFTAPIQISSTYGLKPIDYELNPPSAQVKSAVLLAGLYADGTTRVIENVPTRDHTERMLGLTVKPFGNKHAIEIRGGQKVLPRKFVVPGDISAATFLIAAAALVPNSEITIKNVGLNATRSSVLNCFRSMNVALQMANVHEEGGEPCGDIVVATSDISNGVEVRGDIVPLVIDEIPMLAVTSMFADSVFTLRDATELRYKESDRIASIVQNMRKLGIDIEEYPDGFAFQGKKDLIGTALESYGDHRIAMAFGVAGLRIPGISIRGAECVDISFPGFWNAIQA
ncbi:MAG TPA: 3-phosphoshikimate 1-carboxyvinyltransferase [Bacteroidota bacterium]